MKHLVDHDKPEQNAYLAPSGQISENDLTLWRFGKDILFRNEDDDRFHSIWNKDISMYDKQISCMIAYLPMAPYGHFWSL